LPGASWTSWRRLPLLSALRRSRGSIDWWCVERCAASASDHQDERRSRRQPGGDYRRSWNGRHMDARPNHVAGCSTGGEPHCWFGRVGAVSFARRFAYPHSATSPPKRAPSRLCIGMRTQVSTAASVPQRWPTEPGFWPTLAGCLGAGERLLHRLDPGATLKRSIG